jgi:dCMP deaminase
MERKVNRISREQMMMEWAHTAAKRGTCGRLAVGAVIARDFRPISAGYVGAPSGEPHCEEAGCDLNIPCTRTDHAERNAIKFAVENDINIQGADLFTTDAPCADCSMLIITAKIKRVYYNRPYRAQSIEMLVENGVQVFQTLANGMINEIKYLDDAEKS